MCPPKADDEIDEIGPFWTDRVLFVFLESIQNKSSIASLPSDVFADMNPYLYDPSNLPENVWYLVKSDCPKQSEVGFWRVKDDSCPIYSDSTVIGWRTTLEFYKGHSPNGDRTDWLMHEYSISYEGSNEFKGERSLCRVLLSDKKAENQKMDPNEANSDVIGQNSLIHDDDEQKEQQKMDQNQENGDVGGQNNPLHDEGDERSQAEAGNQVMLLPQNGDLGNAEYPYGDYLELADLLGPLSSSSSSENSSCVSQSSDMYFDSVALLRELEAEDEVGQTMPSGCECSVSRTNETPVSLAEGSSTGNNNKTAEPTRIEARPLEVSSHEKRHHEEEEDAPENAKKRPPPNDVEASSSGQGSEADKGKKSDRNKTIKKFFCFLAF